MLAQSLADHEGLYADPGEPENLPGIPAAGYMQSQGFTVCGEGDLQDRTTRLMTPLELDQEYLYRLWKSGRINDEYVQVWAAALAELQAEADCDYFVWLMQNQPMLVLK